MNSSFFSPFLPYPSLIHLLPPSLSFTHPSSPPSFLILLSYFFSFLPYPALILLLIPSLSCTPPSPPSSFLILLSYFFSSFLPYLALILFLIPFLSCTHPSPPPSFLILLSYFFSTFLPCTKNHPSSPSFHILHSSCSSFLPYPALILLLLAPSLSCTPPSPPLFFLILHSTHPSPHSFLILHSSFFTHSSPVFLSSFTNPSTIPPPPRHLLL